MALGPGLKGSAVLGFGAVLLVGIPALSYFFYFQQKNDELDRQTLALLGVGAERVESRVENARWTAENLAADPTFACEYLERQPLVELERVGEETLQDCEKLENVQSSPEPRARLQAGSRQLRIQAGSAGKSDSFTLVLDLEPMLAGLPLSEHFDQLLVLDQEGSVAAAQRRPRSGPGLEIRRLTDLRLIDADGETTGTLDLKELRRVSSVWNVSVARTPYRLYCQPVSWNADDPEGDIAWALCGLIEGARVQREALAIAPVGTIILLTFFVFSLLSWPFLKVYSMSSRERLRLVDTYFLNISSGILLMLAMMLALLFEGYHDLGLEARDSIAQLATEVAEQLRGEIDQMAEQLETYDQQLLANPQLLPKRERTPATSPSGRPLGEPAFFTEILAPGNHPFSTPATLDLDDGYPWFSSVFWAARDGWQIVKATPGLKNSPRVNVAERPYFAAAQEGATSSADALAPALQLGERKLYVQMMRSMTTGELQAAVSRPSRVSEHAAVMIGPLLSASRPVLSLGHDFAVIDAEGRVQLSTDPRLALDESLLDAVQDRERLAEVAARATRADSGVRGDRFATTFLKRPYFLAVEPVPDLPWSVVAFFDRQLLHTVLIESLCQAIMLSTFYAILFFGGVPAINYLTGKSQDLHHAWAWPDRHKKALLGWLCLIFFGLSGVQLLSLWFRPDYVLSLSFLIPFFALACLAVGHWTGASRTAVRNDKAFLRRGVWAFVGFWLVLAILPATAFFRLAFAEQRLRLVQLESLDFNDKMKQRDAAVRHNLSQLDGAINLADLRLRFEGDVYRATLFDPGDSADRAHAKPIQPQLAFAEPTLEWLMGKVPIYNSVVSRLRFFADDGDDRGGRWLKHQNVVWAPFSERPSQLPAWRTRPGFIGLSVGLGLLALVGIWGYWHTYHLFFGRVAFVERVHEPIARMNAEDLTTGELPALAPGTHLIALLTSPRAPAEIAGAETVYTVVDLLADKLEDVKKRIPKKEPAKKEPTKARPVLCTRMSVALEDPDARAGKLELLEWLVYRQQRTVVVLSMMDPFQLLFGRERHSPPEPSPETDSPPAPSAGSGVSLTPLEARRWGRLLSHFAMVPVPPARCDREVDWIEPELHPLIEARHGKSWENLVRKQTKIPPSPSEDVHEGWFGALRGRFRSLGRQSRQPRLSREALEGKLEAAEGYYWALWNGCSDDEKLVLVHLVQEQVLNPRHARTVRRLLLRGLLRRDSVLKPMNRSFALFVSLFHRRADVRRWESKAEGLGWRNLRWVLIAILAVLGLFLSTTQREQLQGFLGFAPALAAGLPALLTLLGGRPGGSKNGTS